MPIDCSRMLRFSRQFGKFYNRSFIPLLQQNNLSQGDLQVLLFLANNPEYATARDVGTLRGLAKSQVSQSAELLTGRGLLRREQDTADRRVVHLKLTVKGMSLARQAQAIQASCGRAVLAGLTAEEESQLRAILEKVLENGQRLAEEGEQ